jgi:hypothetical protein
MLHEGASIDAEDSPSEAAQRPSPREGPQPKKQRLYSSASNGSALHALPILPRLTGNDYAEDNEYMKNRPKRQVGHSNRPPHTGHASHATQWRPANSSCCPVVVHLDTRRSDAHINR